MSFSTVDTAPARSWRYVGRAEVHDALTGLTLVRTTPLDDPDLWSEYLRGAHISYAKHGVEVVLDADSRHLASETALFFVSIDGTGAVVGGVRGQGAYTSADQSHAMTEWAGNIGREQVRDMIDSRLRDGVVEMKTAWVNADFADAGAVAGALARVAVPTMDAMNVRWIMATAAEHVLRRWESSGGRVAEHVPYAAYPDERYRTRIMWWDRRSIQVDARPDVLSRMYRDARALRHSAAAVAA
ncbi:hypothetical protein DK926_14090 [Rhodococcus sp. Eu-32]|uniref:hypothetical protein n=1 Tax=Rhodococcus sp. Eu-32 TaxID=1017319 RepID=UPI000DF33993|nr:hypothetical protein [Rhodococcus sp. Eu-32]RRQ27243.1 hypothetical protein DK926_14090 [Rhodococcus sp. Eu-32]